MGSATYIEPMCSTREWFAVLYPRPSHFLDRNDSVPGELEGQLDGQRLVKQDAHPGQAPHGRVLAYQGRPPGSAGEAVEV